MSHWLENAVFYQIYPASFKDGNGDGIGDFWGIGEKIGYLKDLGINAIWMNPCYDSSFYDGGYDVKDYYKTASRYGTNEDLRKLIHLFHENGIRVLLDLVAGHTAIDHPWFQASCKDEVNDCTNRYIWQAGGPWAKNYPGIAAFLCGISERPGAVGVNCFSTQPALNYGFGNVTEDWQFSADSPEAESTRLLLQDIMSFWLDLGCDGFRVDMAGSLVKDDPDYRCTIRLWQKVRAFLDNKYPDAVLISEWGNPLQAIEAGFHMDFLLHVGPTHYMDLFRTNPYFSLSSGSDLKEFIRYYRDAYDKTKGKGLICIPSGNHDMIRMRDSLSPEEMKLAFVFLLTMPGCPFIYYGDEIGMRYLHGLKSKEGAYERTGSRTPMQWTGGDNAGFSEASPESLYLPVDTSEDRPDVLTQLREEGSLLRHVQLLIQLRKHHSALRSTSGIRFLTDGSGYPLVYERWDEKEKLLIAINPSPEPVTFSHESIGNTDEILTGDGKIPADRQVRLNLPPSGFAVIQVNRPDCFSAFPPTAEQESV